MGLLMISSSPHLVAGVRAVRAVRSRAPVGRLGQIHQLFDGEIMVHPRAKYGFNGC